jgi:hypothetical protein
VHINNKSKGSSHERCAIETSALGLPMFGIRTRNRDVPSRAYLGRNKSALWSRCYRDFCKEVTGDRTWRWMSIEEARQRSRRIGWAGELGAA